MADESSSSSYSSHACAACNHLGRSCNSSCPLARYFPAERVGEFIQVHRHFNVSNLIMVLKSVPPELQDAMMECIIFEAKAWCRDPVHGALGIIRDLTDKVEATVKELHSVQQQLIKYKNKSQPNQS